MSPRFTGPDARTHRRAFLVAPLAMALAALASPPTVAADTVFTLNTGYFMLRGEDARPDDDVLRRNLDFLAFELDDMNGWTFGGEVFFGVGDFLEVGGGVNYYQRTTSSVYADFVDDDGTEIEQDLKLRTVPITLTARFFPTSRRSAVQPYIGVGIGIVPWRYSEAGEFVDFSDFSVFRDSFVDTGTAVGPVVLGGLRFGFDQFVVGGEFRWQDATGDLDPDLGFAGDRIDVGGYTTLFTFGWKF